MSAAAIAFIAAADFVLWAIIYGFWQANALPWLVLISAFGVALVAMFRLGVVGFAPVYDRALAHQLSWVAIGAALVANVAALCT